MLSFQPNVTFEFNCLVSDVNLYISDVLGLEICISYNIEDASEFVEQWIAYSVSHFHGGEPTIEYLTEFERKDLAGKRDKQLFVKKQSNATSALSISTTAVASSSFQDDDDDMLGAYICNTPKVGEIFFLSNLRFGLFPCFWNSLQSWHHQFQMSIVEELMLYSFLKHSNKLLKIIFFDIRCSTTVFPEKEKSKIAI